MKRAESQFRQDCSKIRESGCLIEGIEKRLKTYLSSIGSELNKPRTAASRASHSSSTFGYKRMDPSSDLDYRYRHHLETRAREGPQKVPEGSEGSEMKEIIYAKIRQMDDKIHRYRQENLRFGKGLGSLVGLRSAVLDDGRNSVRGYSVGRCSKVGLLDEDVRNSSGRSRPTTVMTDYYSGKSHGQRLGCSISSAVGGRSQANLDESERMMQLVESQKKIIFELQGQMKHQRSKTNNLENNIVRYDGMLEKMKAKLSQEGGRSHRREISALSTERKPRRQEAEDHLVDGTKIEEAEQPKVPQPGFDGTPQPVEIVEQPRPLKAMSTRTASAAKKFKKATAKLAMTGLFEKKKPQSQSKGTKAKRVLQCFQNSVLGDKTRESRLSSTAKWRKLKFSEPSGQKELLNAIADLVVKKLNVRKEPFK